MKTANGQEFSEGNKKLKKFPIFAMAYEKWLNKKKIKALYMLDSPLVQ